VVVIATGPLTSANLAEAIADLTGSEHLYFYDAMAPIIAADSIDMSVAYRANRYGEAGVGDYLNCPLSKEKYERLVGELVGAPTIALRDFEREDPRFFEACLPIEVLARRGEKALAFGPLRPVGLVDPRTGQRPYAVVQLRQDDQAASLFNMVGFQTNLKWSEQTRIFRQIPGLEGAEIVRFGQMHRNTFINSPLFLRRSLQFRGKDGLLFAGQITGTEGYVGSVASGLLAGINAVRVLDGAMPVRLPRTTMMGALFSYVSSADARTFQPMKANFGLLPALLPPVRKKRERYAAYMRRALADLESSVSEWNLQPPRPGS
jgi:methylenetetrahydrofolate--tRNA-(uracil-5-)-methyltransferase